PQHVDRANPVARPLRLGVGELGKRGDALLELEAREPAHRRGRTAAATVAGHASTVERTTVRLLDERRLFTDRLLPSCGFRCLLAHRLSWWKTKTGRPPRCSRVGPARPGHSVQAPPAAGRLCR